LRRYRPRTVDCFPFSLPFLPFFFFSRPIIKIVDARGLRERLVGPKCAFFFSLLLFFSPPSFLFPSYEADQKEQNNPQRGVDAGIAFLAVLFDGRCPFVFFFFPLPPFSGTRISERFHRKIDNAPAGVFLSLPLSFSFFFPRLIYRTFYGPSIWRGINTTINSAGRGLVVLSLLASPPLYPFLPFPLPSFPLFFFSVLCPLPTMH